MKLTLISKLSLGTMMEGLSLWTMKCTYTGSPGVKACRCREAIHFSQTKIIGTSVFLFNIETIT